MTIDEKVQEILSKSIVRSGRSLVDLSEISGINYHKLCRIYRKDGKPSLDDIYHLGPYINTTIQHIIYEATDSTK